MSQRPAAVRHLSPVASNGDALALHPRPVLPDSPHVPRLLLKPEEAAAALAFGRSTVYELMATGELPYVKRGRSRRIRWTDLEAFANGLSAEAC